MQTYRGWPLLDELPDGWRIDKSAGSPLRGYDFCTNGKNILSGNQKRALVRILPPQLKIGFDGPERQEVKPKTEPQEEKPAQVIDAHYVRTVNELARQKFKQKILNDILVDLMICEIEGWCKMEYINEIRKMINEIGIQACIEAYQSK